MEYSKTPNTRYREDESINNPPYEDHNDRGDSDISTSQRISKEGDNSDVDMVFTEEEIYDNSQNNSNNTNEFISIIRIIIYGYY